MSGLWNLQWFRKRHRPSVLPEGVERTYINVGPGNLELLYALPSGEKPHSTPLLFVHGGFGCAEVYTDYLLYFARRGFHVYAVSIRGHGNSFYPSYIWMTFFTSFHTLALDACAAIDYITKVHGTAPIYFGHSSGGGMGQYITSNHLAPISALGLLAPIPGFGGIYVYNRWGRMDPWFVIRCYLRDWGHPKSPLSSTALVRNAFFSPALPKESVLAFEEKMPPWESLRWPFSMMLKFVNYDRVVTNISGSFAGGSRMLVLAASRDALMGTRLMGQLADIYRASRRALQSNKKVEAIADVVIEDVDEVIEENGGAKRGTVDGVTFDVVEGAGHQYMNDVQWERSADIIYDWLKGITRSA